MSDPKSDIDRFLERINIAYKNYETMESFICEAIPEDGFIFKDQEQLRSLLNHYLPEQEADEAALDSKLSRAEFIGLTAGVGNKDRSHFQITNNELNLMGDKMEKWGLDVSNPWEKRMLKGLAKVHKHVISIKELENENKTEMRQQFNSAKNPESKVNQNDQKLSTDQTVKYNISNAPKI